MKVTLPLLGVRSALCTKWSDGLLERRLVCQTWTWPVERPPGGLPQALLQPVRAVRLALYRSELKPQGAQYTPLAQVKLR